MKASVMLFAAVVLTSAVYAQPPKAQYQQIIAEAADYSYGLRRLESDPHFVEWLARTRYGDLGSTR